MSAPSINSVRCPVCFRRCALAEGQTGFCGARTNRGGRIAADSYGCITALALDPIEKKPLARFRPGSLILSVGSYGCNLTCPFCQNHDISRMDAATFRRLYEAGKARMMSPEEVASLAQSLIDRGNIGIAFTYNEPTLCPEFIEDTTALAHQAALATVLVTNGSAAPKTWQRIMQHIDAANIDLKAFRPELYRRLGGSLSTVQANIRTAAPESHIEVTTLIIPGFNDSIADMRAEAAWLASIDPGIPLHLSRFFPRYCMTDRPPTNVDLIYRLREVAGDYLNHVYTGNC